uniref:NADH dehydrogenase subunit 2 n=1 Tax=Philonthus spinipes TaxID=878362 RepID=UPI001FA72ADE|nr:NADH dehydrogenase subunit 2 [Philonthus spinipes]ULT46824.1 NADH dehydrogenase subunit 2 [Philonthus spinipes]
MKLYKILFFVSMMIGTLISISSMSWMGMWMGLEINLLSIIPLMNSNKNLFASEASLKYFITQALASTILLFSIILSLNYTSILIHNMPNEGVNLIFNSALLTKMGAAPFHFWFPEIIDGLSWLNCLIMLSWQKIAPMVILMFNINYPLFFMMIIIMCMLISGTLGFNQTSIRKIMAYSSINHIGWLLASMFTIESIWLIYFLTYTIILINIIMIFNLLNIFYFKQLIIAMNNNIEIKFFFVMNFLSLGGLPPFLGFMPKWLTIETLIESKFIILTLIMVILTLLTLYLYVRLMFSTLTINLNEINFIPNLNSNQFMIFLSNFISISGLLSCSILFNLT